jgi:signal transduction histidine kinase
VEISIRDYGPGVPEETLPHIFDPSFRADASRDPATGNVGLGLAIARRAVQIHHGKITAENAHPGLRVHIEVPCTVDISPTAVSNPAIPGRVVGRPEVVRGNVPYIGTDKLA